mgnify:FL=1
MPKLPKLAAFDLDGTLLNSQKVITPRTLAAVRALADTGCVCVLASGRMYRDCMEGHVAQLGLDTPVIAYNGALVLNPTSGEIWHETSVSPALCAPVLEHVRASGQHLNFYFEDRMYCPRPSEWGDLYIRRVGAKPIYRDDLYDWAAGRAATKLLIVDDPAEIERCREQFQAFYGDRLYITITEHEYLEFMNPTVSKGKALLALCARLGIDPADSVGFGDAPNDIPLLEDAGTGYAMAGARPEVLAAADAVAPGNDEDGVAQVIEGWLSGV